LVFCPHRGTISPVIVKSKGVRSANIFLQELGTKANEFDPVKEVSDCLPWDTFQGAGLGVDFPCT
jgi:hypothetical protein